MMEGDYSSPSQSGARTKVSHLGPLMGDSALSTDMLMRGGTCTRPAPVPALLPVSLTSHFLLSSSG